MPAHRVSSQLIALLVVAIQTGCQELLMPTPVVYEDVRFSPCSGVPEALRSTSIRVFYATTRTPAGDPGDRGYKNKVGDQIRVGEAIVALGPRGLTWDELSEASVTSKRARDITVKLKRAFEFGALADGRKPPEAGAARPLNSPEQAFVDGINDAMRRSRIRKIFVYVHGAKVDFEHACMISAELYHFLGRAGAAVGFAWPTGQTLLSYGSDIKRGREAGDDFARVLDLLSRTEAEQIDLISYSAGALVLAGGLVTLREAHADLDDAALAARFRITDVVFAAADISMRRFATDLLPRMYDLPRRIQVTISDKDSVLSLAQIMHGSSRLGRPNLKELDEAAFMDLRQRDKLVVIDTNFAEEARGLKIPGHGYWFRNPWAATDTLISLRFDATPEERGLMWRGADNPLTWYFPPDYTQRVTTSLLAGMDLPPDATVEQVEQWLRENGRVN